MTQTRDRFTAVENQFHSRNGGVTEEQFSVMSATFDRLPYKSYKMSEADMRKLMELMPNLDIDQVRDCEVKPKQGVCRCGRQMTLLDLIAQALHRDSHSAAFLQEIFNGNRGKWVIVGLHRKV
jgi:hypothetical protein